MQALTWLYSSLCWSTQCRMYLSLLQAYTLQAKKHHDVIYKPFSSYLPTVADLVSTHSPIAKYQMTSLVPSSPWSKQTNYQSSLLGESWVTNACTLILNSCIMSPTLFCCSLQPLKSSLAPLYMWIIFLWAPQASYDESPADHPHPLSKSMFSMP